MEPKVCQKSLKMVAKGDSKEILGKQLVEEAVREHAERRLLETSAPLGSLLVPLLPNIGPV